MFLTDFHTHFLPDIDDGSPSTDISLEMLKISANQGVDAIIATPHFYPTEEDPNSFLQRRITSVNQLKQYVAIKRSSFRTDPQNSEEIPKLPMIYLGAEVYYFPTISTCEELNKLRITGTNLILVELPMIRWNPSLLQEIKAIESNLGLKPVLAHVDRYARMMNDPAFFDLAEEYDLLVQVNTSFLLRHEDIPYRGCENIIAIGSDCHDTENRLPNLEEAIYSAGITGGREWVEDIMSTTAELLHIS